MLNITDICEGIPDDLEKENESPDGSSAGNVHYGWRKHIMDRFIRQE